MTRGASPAGRLALENLAGGRCREESGPRLPAIRPSRKSFYKWKQRHAEHGDAGLGDWSRNSLRATVCRWT